MGAHDAHGRFDARATGSSGYLWLTTHRWVVAVAALFTAFVVVVALTIAA
jgi:hypothetical protein